MLTWKTAESADRDDQDHEVDLSPIGNPGGAQWASVAEEQNGFHWGVYAHWLWEDIDNDPNGVLAQGMTATMDEGKAAVQAWVEEHK